MRGPMTARTATWTTIALALCSAPFGASSLLAQAAQTTQAPAAAPAAEATDPAQAEELARQHFQLGRAQYQGGSFSEAATSFEHAYALSKREMLWYNIYLAHRDAGNNKQSAIALRNYLERVPELENRAQLEARLESLDRIVAQEEQREREASERAAAQQQPSEESDQAAPAPALVAQESPSVKREESSSLVPYILMGVGGAMVVGGVVVGAMAAGKHSELEDKCGPETCDPSLESLADEGKTLNITADILLFGGIAAAGTGAVLWFLDSSDDSSSEQPVRAAVSCGPGACNGRVAVSF
jgi:tetratricopeptide (TPR) repeat protein